MAKRTTTIAVWIAALSIIAILGIVSLLCFYGITRQRVRIESVSMELWMGREIPELVGLVPDETTPVLAPQNWDARSVTFGDGTEGLIELADDQWVYIQAYSSHGSGNLILARDSEGHLHASNGHICPHLSIYWDDRPPPATLTLKDFLSSKPPLAGGRGRADWRPVDHWRDGPHRRVEIESVDELLKAARTLKKGATKDDVLLALGLSHGSTGGKDRYSLFWEYPKGSLCVYLTYDQAVCEIHFEPKTGKRVQILAPR